MKPFYFILVLFWAIPQVGLAQDPNSPKGYQMIHGNSLVVINNSESTIQYELKRSIETEWIPYTIETGTKVTYRLNRNEDLHIRLCTRTTKGQSCVAYLLERTKRYQLYWNIVDQQWDVSEVDE